MFTHQASGDQPADVSGGAGEQDRAVGTEGGGGVVGRAGDASEPGGEDPAGAQGDLGFVARGDGGQEPQRCGVAIGVGQEESSGGLGLRGTQEAPDGGGGEAGRGARADRPLGDGEQTGAGQPFVEEQGAGGLQGRGRVVVCRAHRVVVPVAHGPYEEVGRGGRRRRARHAGRRGRGGRPARRRRSAAFPGRGRHRRPVRPTVLQSA
ncbi:hypothetical protein IHE61_22060 [Streptomyces sp. GKU 257-1]|nr:hypothetical protein [Streptomyces sp. GKU 257-1]